MVFTLPPRPSVVFGFLSLFLVFVWVMTAYPSFLYRLPTEVFNVMCAPQGFPRLTPTVYGTGR
jgi:hypothetical protein